MYLRIKIKCLSIADAVVYYKIPDNVAVDTATVNALAMLGDSIIVKAVDVVHAVVAQLTYQECIYRPLNAESFDTVIVHSNIVLNKALPVGGKLLDIRRQF